MSVNVEKLARTGANEIRIAAAPFDVKMELENIYLRGQFAVEATGKGFRLVAPRALEFGSWLKQGYPFYGDAVTYSASIAVPAGSNRLKVALPEWSGSVAVVLVDGKPAANLGWQPFEATVPVTPGSHEVGVRIVSTPRRQIGLPLWRRRRATVAGHWSVDSPEWPEND